jgi:hypothetical protein
MTGTPDISGKFACSRFGKAKENPMNDPKVPM